MSSSSRSNFLYTLSERKVLLLAIPALLVLAALLVICRQSEKAPATVATPDTAQAVSSTTPAGSGQIDPNRKQAIEQIIKDYLVKTLRFSLRYKVRLKPSLRRSTPIGSKSPSKKMPKNYSGNPMLLLQAIPTAISRWWSSSTTIAATASVAWTTSQSAADGMNRRRPNSRCRARPGAST